jgi:putative ABC transport system permease protein
MLKNLLQHSLRSFKRQRTYLFINILGLSIGLICALFIALFIANEVSYDRYNIKKDRIFRLVLDSKIAGNAAKGPYTPAQMGAAMMSEFPEVEDYLRMDKKEPSKVIYKNQVFNEEKIIEADSSFFNFFTIRVLNGDPKSLLNSPHKVVLSESTVRRYFGDENPIDKPIKIGTDTVSYIVSGVVADIPENTHFAADFIISLCTDPGANDPVWMDCNFSTYLLLKPNSSYSSVDKKIPGLLAKHIGEEIQKYLNMSADDFFSKGNKYGFYCQNLKDIHLDSTVMQKFKPAGDPRFLKILGCIAFLILLIASVNFMNLSTAQAARRAKEVGLKKLCGSSRGMLIGQFLFESFILVLISLIVAVIFIKILLPVFNNLLDTRLSPGLASIWFMLPLMILFAIVVGFISGSYPAFYLSSFNPYEVLKGHLKNRAKNYSLRRVLVVFQFTVSILLIVGTIIMFRQINYMVGRDLGFNKESLIVIKGAGVLGTKVKSFREAVKGIPGVVSIAGSTAVPGRGSLNSGYIIEGKKNEMFSMETNFVDYDYLNTYGITLTSGRTFSSSFSTDENACIVNEVVVREQEIRDLARARFMPPVAPGTAGTYLQLIGIVKDFNFKSLRNSIGAYIFRLKDENTASEYLSVKLSSKDYAKTISAIENKWKEFTMNSILDYYFVDDDFAQMYKSDRQNALMAVIFSVLAIFIASLGLFGLTSFTVEQRTKEIGIRKAMGSSVTGVYTEISREVILLILISAIIAWPIIYFIAGKWLQNFYYRINPGVFSFVAGLIIAAGIALLTISYRIIKAAMRNPCHSLKYE